MIIIMNNLLKHNRNRFIIGLISLLSMSFVASAPFESNPQACGMIIDGKENKKQKQPGKK
ncbi:hypothetical protein HYN43_000500 [Mucilaginibacter celer]|uniref:Cyclic lactone autoinducer peptide n=2 Tax=Mucilaginibacter celer TaxID=2305508 RepID=A0A494VGZ0_9SPHI|nr:hypothetical protein HYN43_000500 [Mucilaginibacter celer]